MTGQPLLGRCVELLKTYMETKRTDQLKELALLLVALRGSHSLNDGRTDWSGRSQEYRADMRYIYREAGVLGDELDTVQAAIRYHVGNLLRTRASRADLEAVGLSAIAPKERLAAARRAVQWRRRCTCACTCGADQFADSDA